MKSIFESNALFFSFLQFCLLVCWVAYILARWERYFANVQNPSVCEISPREGGTLAWIISSVSALSVPSWPLPSSWNEPSTLQFKGETAENVPQRPTLLHSILISNCSDNLYLNEEDGPCAFPKTSYPLENPWWVSESASHFPGESRPSGESLRPPWCHLE